MVRYHLHNVAFIKAIFVLQYFETADAKPYTYAEAIKDFNDFKLLRCDQRETRPVFHLAYKQNMQIRRKMNSWQTPKLSFIFVSK